MGLRQFLARRKSWMVSRLVRTVDEGEMLPSRWWGVAWHEYDKCRTVAMPIPLNIAASWVRRVWLDFRFRFVAGPTFLQQQKMIAWRDGYATAQGRADRALEIARSQAEAAGYRRGRSEAFALVQAQFDEYIETRRTRET